MDWKQEIIWLTEGEEARAKKIDASFFPGVSEDGLEEWEVKQNVSVPEELGSFLLVSDGLEVQRGEIWPVLPLEKWELIEEG